jgi:hypothetical protein
MTHGKGRFASYPTRPRKYGVAERSTHAAVLMQTIETFDPDCGLLLFVSFVVILVIFDVLVRTYAVGMMRFVV